MFRPAQWQECALISSFQVVMAKETEDFNLSPDVVRKGVEHMLLNPQKGCYYVWDEPNEGPVACLLTVPEWSEWRNGTVLWIHSVYVKPPYRRRGLFRTMYQALKTKVEQDPGLWGLRLYVEKSNIAAQKVYRALGMTDEHYQCFEWLKEEAPIEQPELPRGDLHHLMDELLPLTSRLTLRSRAGTVELRGDDLTSKVSEKSLTVYHERAPHSEAQSHIHLRKDLYRYAQRSATDRGTPFVAFLTTRYEPVSEADLKIYLHQAPVDMPGMLTLQ